MRTGCSQFIFKKLGLALLLALILAGQAHRAPGCLTDDGKPPSWGHTPPNQYMVDQVNLAHRIAKLNGLQTPTTPPISGSHKTVIILIEDATDGCPFNSSYKTASLWSTRLKQFDNYYNEVSRGILRIVPAAETFGTANDGVIGPVRAPSLNSSSDIEGAQSAVPFIEAIRAANPYINFASFDKNGDGKITSNELHILIYQAGDEKSKSGSFVPRAWAHNKYNSTGFLGSIPVLDSDNKIITSYCYCGSEFNGYNMATQGQMTHELGHDLGLPDLYDTDDYDSGGKSSGLGDHCLMAGGSWGTNGGTGGDCPCHIDAYYKAWLGWATPVVATPSSNATYALPAANGNNSFVRVNIPGFNQFFVIENRQQTGFDAGLPGAAGGLIVYHCDAAILNPGINVNDNPNNLGIAVEQADGRTSLHDGTDRGSDKDYFRVGNKVDFTNTTTPNTKTKNGSYTGLSVTAVTASAPTMMFNIGTVLPVFSVYSINYGAATTKSRIVTLYNTIAGNVTPKYYMASESPTFAGAAWQTYSNVPKFTLSSGNAWHTVYLKVKDSYNHETGTRTDAIILDEMIPLELGPNWNSQEIKPAGELDWFSFVVPAADYYAIETQAGTLTDNYLRLYGPGNQTTLITQDDNSGPGNMARIVRYLTPGTYYIRSQAVNTLLYGTYQIRVNNLPRPVVTSFAINNGALETATRKVMLNILATGTVTHYMISENSSLIGAAWQPWTTGNIPYSLISAGDGVKPVYLLLKNEAGITATASDRIDLRSIAIKPLLIYKSSATNVNAYAAFLQSRGMAPTVVKRDDLSRTDLSKYHVIILGEESGDTAGWGTQTQIDKIKSSLKPVVGIGNGGYQYFGKLALTIGYPNGWSNTQAGIWVVDGGHTVFNVPNSLMVTGGATLPLYTSSTDVAIYQSVAMRGIGLLGREINNTTHYPLIMQGTSVLWGFNGSAAAMTNQGKNLFENTVRYAAGLVLW